MNDYQISSHELLNGSKSSYETNNKFLNDKKSCISHIVHDEIVIDLDDTERDIVPDIKEMFENNKIGKFLCNLNAGQNYYDLKALYL